MKTTLQKAKLLTLAILATGVASLITIPSPARADENWTGTADTNWNNALNWSGTAVPVSTTGWTFVTSGTSSNPVPVISADPSGNSVVVGVGSWYSTGRLDQTAGILTGTATDWPGGSMLVGFGSYSNGTYNIADTTTTGGAFTGYGTGSGSYTTGQWGSILVAAGWYWDNSTAVMNINTSGTVNANGQMAVGGRNGDVATVNLDAGTVTVAGGWDGGLSTEVSMKIAVGSGTTTSTGNLNISGGTVSLGKRLIMGAGTADFSGSGTLANPYVYGSVASGSSIGTVTITGGTLTTGTGAIGSTWNNGVDMASGIDGGVGGTATFNLNGGTLTTTHIFSGGVVTTGTNLAYYVYPGVSGTTQGVRLTGTAGTSIFNFNGGTLQVQTADPSYQNLMSGLTRANVRNGGAVIDTNGVDSYFTQALVHSNIGGDAAIDGGLTKNGDGQLTIQTASSFTGPVVVNQGTLYASGPDYAGGTFASSSGITVMGGAVLKANNNSLYNQYNTYNGAAGPLTVNAGATAISEGGGQQFVGLVILNGGELGSQGAVGANGSWTFGHFSSAMKLAVTDDSDVTASKVAFYNGATIDVTSGKTLTFDGTIADSGTNATSVIVGGSGSGTVVLNGINTYTGSTTVNNGTVEFNQPDATVTTLTGGLDVATSGTAVITEHGGGAESVKVLDLSALSITTSFALQSNSAESIGSPAPVPEPGTWALMIGGLGVLGFYRKLGHRKN